MKTSRHPLRRSRPIVCTDFGDAMQRIALTYRSYVLLTWPGFVLPSLDRKDKIAYDSVRPSFLPVI
eukprot:5356004-Amphidinium_carterae.1